MKNMRIQMQKTVPGMLDIHVGEITKYVEHNHIDAIVNAANPTLMGSIRESVDKSIHKKVNRNLKNGNKFKDKIRKQIDGNNKEAEEKIRCARGQAVVTKGYSLCKYVIHVVGPQCDGASNNRNRSWCCTSNCTSTLESCYRNIMAILKEHWDIQEVAIPIIGSGNYDIPFELAVRIAIATIGNILVEWEAEDGEYFQYMALKKITFCVFGSDGQKERELAGSAQKILNNYDIAFAKKHRVVYQLSWSAQTRYIYDLIKYDKNRGYFAIARAFRMIMLLIRTIFMPVLWIKDIVGGYDWNRRRETVEIIAFVKLILPLGIYVLLRAHITFGKNNIGYEVLIVYLMADTVSYLICLIVLADVQRPSANVIRSIILLLVNYLEVSLDFAVLYYLEAECKVAFSEILAYSVLDKEITENLLVMNGVALVLDYAKTGMQFFFMTMAFGYFANHMHQRRFRS